MKVNWLPKEPNCACNSSFTEICGDGYDNNCNNRIDCVLGKEDPSCNCPTCDTVESSANNNCDDGIDNDCDGNISIPCGNPGSSCDCADIGCAMDSVCTGCDDNDLDGYSTNGGSCGLIDCDDDITNDPGGICPSNSASCNTATSKCAICTHPGANEVCTDGIDNNCNNECDYDSSICVKGDIACKVDLANITVSNYFPLENTNFRLICNTGSSASGTEVNSIYAKVDNTFCTFNNFLSQNSYNFTCNAGSYATGNKSATCYVNTSKSYSNFNITSAQIDVQQTCTPNCNGKDCGDDGCSPYNEQDCGTCISGEQCINFQCLDNSECNIALVSWNKNSTLNGSIVNLFLFGTDLCSGKTISFDIYEDNDSKHITEIGGEDPEDVIYGIYGRGIWEARYLTEESDLKNEFFFKATINGTTYESGTGYNAVKWLNVNSACINIMTCDNYTDQESCEDNCGGSDVLDRSALEVYGQQCGIEYCLADRWVSNCQCKWENNKCVFYGEDTDCTGNNVTGWCKKTQGTVIGCDDENNPTPGYYTSSWSGIIMFLHSGWNTKNGCQTANNDFVEGHCANTSATSQIDGKWYYYPRGVDSCEEGGTSTIECPAEMNLPFFGAYNFVITIMVISIIYFLLTRKRKI